MAQDGRGFRRSGRDLVEISTDKVDAEVPAPIDGTVVKVHAAEGDTIHVGAVLAEIAPTNGAAPTEVDEAVEEQVVDVVMPQMGESVSEGVVLEWTRKVGDSIAVDETIVEISTDKVDAEVPAPASGTVTEILAEAGETVTVGQVIARMTAGAEAAEPAAAPEPRPAAEPPAVDVPDGSKITPVAKRVAAALGVDLSTVHGSGPAGRIGKDDVLAAANGATATAAPAGGATLIKGASAMLARYMDESRQVPTATSFRTVTVTTLDARRKQLKEAGQRVSFTHLIAYAIARAATEQMPVMAHHFDEIDGKPHVIDDGACNLGIAVDVERKDGGRTLMVPVIRDAGRLGFQRVPRRVRRADREGAREPPRRRRPPGRQRLAHQPGRDRHDRVGAAADEGPGHARRHRLDRLPAGARRGRRDDRRREGDDDDVDVRPSHHPGRRVRPVPAGRRVLPAGRARLLRAGLRRPRRDARRDPAAARLRPPPRRLSARPRSSSRRPPAGCRSRPTRRCCRRSRPRPRCSRRTACTATSRRSSTRCRPSPRATRRSTPRRSG